MLNQVKRLVGKGILLILLSAVFLQQCQTVLLKMDFSYLLSEEELDNDESNDSGDEFEWNKICDYDNQTCLVNLQLNKVQAQLKSYFMHNSLVFIQAIVGAIDAPPPERA